VAFTPIAVDAQQVLCVAIGAIVLWVKNGYTGQGTFAFGPLTDLIFTEGKWVKFRGIVEFVLFVGFGVAIAIALTQPANVQQAVAAGLGWTGLLTTDKKRKSPVVRGGKPGSSNAAAQGAKK
jgi:hypothetical protein